MKRTYISTKTKWLKFIALSGALLGGVTFAQTTSSETPPPAQSGTVVVPAQPGTVVTNNSAGTTVVTPAAAPVTPVVVAEPVSTASGGVAVTYTPNLGGILGAELNVGGRPHSHFRYDVAALGLWNLRNTGAIGLGVRPLGVLPLGFELGGAVFADWEWTSTEQFGGGHLGAIIGPHIGWHYSAVNIYYEPVYFTNTEFGGAGRGGAWAPIRFGVGLQF